MTNDKVEDLITIGEISRLTGMNSVTLRAWERRYGLIKPLRTPKGHRLYRKTDVDLIASVQEWLSRGIAIGKISELLKQNLNVSDTVAENTWSESLSDLLSLLEEFNLGKLDASLNQLFSVYPPGIIADHLLFPMLEFLNKDLYGNAIKRSIIVNRVSEFVLMLTHRQRQSVRRERIGIINLTMQSEMLPNALIHYGLTSSQFRSELIGRAVVNEMPLVTSLLSLDAVVVYNDICSSLADFQKEILSLSQKITVPLFISGSVSLAMDMDIPPNVNLIRSEGLHSLINAVNEFFPAVGLKV